MSIEVYVFMYFFIGAIFCLTIDMINTYYNNQAEYRDDSINFSNLERFALTIVWPYGLFIFLWNLYKNLRK
jgi:hypothetical protein